MSAEEVSLKRVMMRSSHEREVIRIAGECDSFVPGTTSMRNACLSLWRAGVLRLVRDRCRYALTEQGKQEYTALRTAEEK